MTSTELSNRTALISQLEEIRSFVNELENEYEDPSVVRWRQELARVREKAAAAAQAAAVPITEAAPVAEATASDPMHDPIEPWVAGWVNDLMRRRNRAARQEVDHER